METKPWWQSKAIWTGVVGLLVVIYNAIPTFLPIPLPPVPEWVLGILAALGVSFRASATTRIG